MTAGEFPGAKRVGFLELFFDLVFVFAVTQLVAALHDDHRAVGWGRAVIILWFIWWAWSQYTWAGNAIDLDRRSIRIWMLVATGSMLVAATAIPSAFGDGGRWFAVPYTAVRLVGLALYWFGLSGDPAHRAALRTYLPIAAVGPMLILVGGFAGGSARTVLWCLAIGIDIASAASAGRGEFQVDPAHFAERHGLIVIIALGESVIATGLTAAETGLTRDVVALLAIAFTAVAGLWWCYFDWVHHAAQARLAGEPDHRRRSNLARDLFTFGHLPIVAGVVVFAAGIEDALAHPTESLDPFAVTALAAGPALYLGGFVAGNLRATGRLLHVRLVGLAVVAAAALVAGPRAPALVTVAAVTATILTVAVLEGRAQRAPRAVR